jgi:GT2 family glycosyltransferase
MRISCSVVSFHNPPEQIARTLHSVTASPGNIKLYLLDNSRTDVLAATARKAGARYVHLPSNPGFGAAHNMAIREAIAGEYDYHLVLNPDIAFGPEVISALVAYMQAHPDVGLVMPDIRYPDGRRQCLCKLLPNPVDLLLRRFMPALYRASGRLATYELHRSGYDRVMDVPSLSGCFMFLRTSVLRQVGGFDEGFFLYMEDFDLSRRIGRVARTVFYPAVSVTHEYQQGSYKNPALLRHHLRSAFRYFNKWGWLFDAERRTVNRRTLNALDQSLLPEAVVEQRK